MEFIIFILLILAFPPLAIVLGIAWLCLGKPLHKSEKTLKVLLIFFVVMAILGEILAAI